jgi:transcriptional regulator with GAF, ATPase, and Fis domain
MPSVIISKDSHFFNVFPLDGNTHIGRGLGNDVVLDAAGVSRKHARIENIDGQYFLIDEGSTNGTYVNDQRIQRYLLDHSASFRIHDYLFTFVNDIGAQQGSSFGLVSFSDRDDASWDEVTSAKLITHIETRRGLAHKIRRLLQLVTELYAFPADTDIGAHVLSALFEITIAKRGIVAGLNESGEATILCMRGFGPDVKLPEAIHDILKQVINAGDAVYYRCAAEEMAGSDVPPPTDLRSVLCTPLKENDQPIGCIYLDHPDFNGVFSDTDRDLMTESASYIAEAIFAQRGPKHGLGRDEERLIHELEAVGIIARSPQTLKVFQDIQRIAHYNVAVLIYGETGTGKEVIARYIHSRSCRRGQFIACNCSAVTASMFESELFGHEKGAFTGATKQKPGLLELANKGTLFLDEIGDMPMEQQAKLLRALQEQEVWRVGGSAPVKIDVRIIAATHKDIKNNRAKLGFRDDLYYRLANVEITAPPLKDRTEDIGPLACMILRNLEGHDDLSISPKAVRLLEAYDWPGNIRELRNTLFQIAYRCDGNIIRRRHLKDRLDIFEASPNVSQDEIVPLIDVEREHIQKAMQYTEWNKSAAAKILDIDRNRLSRRLKKLEIEEPSS